MRVPFCFPSAARFLLLALVGLVASLALASCHFQAERPVLGVEALFPAEQWVPLFDGDSLAGWRVADEFDFSSHGAVRFEDGALILEEGSSMTGIARTAPFPRDGYEVRLEAMRVEGSDFFCGLTFPVAEEYCTLILGGWGGNVIGLSNINDLSAIENETTTSESFQNGAWYAVRLRVTPAKIEAWVDSQQVIDVERTDRRFTIWWEQEPMRPLGVATYYTKAALRNFEARRL